MPRGEFTPPPSPSVAQEEYRRWADAVRSDHDDGSAFFCPASAAEWAEEDLNPFDVGAFCSVQEASEWLEKEIGMLKDDGLDSHAEMYQRMLQEGICDPVIVSRLGTAYRLWDGYHRTAVALVRGERLPAIVGTITDKC